MADFIPQQGQQEMVAPEATQFITPEQNTKMAQTAASAGPPPPPSQGPSVGAGLGGVQENPMEAPDEPVSEEEQREHDDLFLRAMAMVNDTRVPPKKDRSLFDQIVKTLATKGKEAYISIGMVGGMLMSQLLDTAKRQKQEYSGAVVQEVGMELMVELIDIARDTGAITNVPEDETPEYDKLLELAALEGAKYFGEHQIKTGQADQIGHRKELDEQMQREADSGELDNWGMEEMDPSMRNALVYEAGKRGMK